MHAHYTILLCRLKLSLVTVHCRFGVLNFQLSPNSGIFQVFLLLLALGEPSSPVSSAIFFLKVGGKNLPNKSVYFSISANVYFSISASFDLEKRIRKKCFKSDI